LPPESVGKWDEWEKGKIEKEFSHNVRLSSPKIKLRGWATITEKLC